MQRILFILISIIVFTACHPGMRKDDSLFDGGSMKVFRYDRLQYEAVAMNSVSALQKMNLECPQVTKILIEDILLLGRIDDHINERLCAYYSDSTLLSLMEDAVTKYSDMSAVESSLTKGFKALKEEIPSFVVPRVYSLISALNQSVVVGDSLLGFSIDKYMGEDYPLYRRFYYKYQRRTMTPERIVPDCFTFYLLSQYPFGWKPGFRSLYDMLLYRGKIYWTVCKILGMKSSEALGYTKEETAWCRKNGKKLWQWMTEQHLLESTDPMIIRAFTHADPSPLFAEEPVPPMVGSWVGIQLIDKYMKEHSEVSLGQLLECDDFGSLRLD